MSDSPAPNRPDAVRRQLADYVPPAATALGVGVAAAWALFGGRRQPAGDPLLLRALQAEPLPRKGANLAKFIADTLHGLDRGDVVELLGPPARTLGNTLVFATSGDPSAPLILVTFDAADEVAAVDCLAG